LLELVVTRRGDRPLIFRWGCGGEMASREESLAAWRRVCEHLRRRLGPAEYLVVCIMAGYGGVASRSALDVAFSRRTVERALTRLVEAGVVRRSRRGHYELRL